jgi:DMSO/TMAO reductase YedYZ molybdopterin-dependent catalytic subunit
MGFVATFSWEYLMSTSLYLHISRVRKAGWTISAFCLFLTIFLARDARSQESSIKVSGEVLTELSLSLDDIRAMPSFFIRDVPVIPERVRDRKDEELVTQTTFRGVLLRDVLYKAGMKNKRKWEPGVFIQIRNKDNRELVFSFGEIFYSSIGRSVLLAYEKEDKPCPLTLVVATDIHSGRMMKDISQITVVRVNIELLAYKDQDKKIVRPPSTEFALIDKATQNQRVIKPEDLKSLPSIHIPAAVLIGECEGFHGIHSLDGVALAALLKSALTLPDPAPYSRYVLVTSEDGYTAVFSFGELFNSRLGDRVVIATVKDGKILSPGDGFAMSIVEEDSTGGRSVKRIKQIEVR